MHSLWRTLICAAILSTSARASADDDVAKAAKAYRQAQQAELGEEYALASDLYELADQLAPSPEALRGATRMALSAQRWAVAAGLARTLQARYPGDTNSLELASRTLERTRPLLSEVAVDCGGVECTVLLDGKAATLDARLRARGVRRCRPPRCRRWFSRGNFGEGRDHRDRRRIESRRACSTTGGTDHDRRG
jgi:hypothetical protein